MKWVFSCALFIWCSAPPAAAQNTSSPSTSGTIVADSLDQAVAAQQPEPKKEAAPEHLSTGWSSLLKDSASDFVAFPKRKSTWTMLGLGAAAALAVHPADEYVETHIVGNEAADNFFSLGQWVGSAYVQFGSAVGLWAIGRYVVPPGDGGSRTNKYSEVGFDLLRAQILSGLIVQGMKYTVQRDRPSGACCAFPSGHAAAAFAAAAVLERHLGYRLSWPALAGATYVATSRLVDNRHFLSDVVFGAAVGTASGWTVVGTRGRKHPVVIQPIPVKGGIMIAVMRMPE
ncbi:MAG TPA: phosphatase PAP2 family protein [Vicinamibacterales bacterium]|nr:phosphatase PAP2 family protein [Vicinamibacterales bacterium]